ncbi:sigma-70 family RNA polymerase sigma factor [Roseospira visakhapatnamensis]|uniref:RNA polymerase sigma-70 factor (ECF subfamily) n=1 Tax=Roseospira visakhapatnamensis TaxID=390880 RepID=A0A7W6RDJ5_9PROT|nr:sigma-70 family RNA polymerase sigma factor [Roseospira visakhapatnamensis]MBB4265918.1 RNA polymerase sigma-70 factor (ECF subfamily) [Roseospira visakhapatnamensis]
MSSFNQDLIDALPHMRAFAYSLTSDRALADDLAQEAATRALSNSDSFQPGTNFRAWVFTIVRNTFYSEFRRSWRRHEQADEDGMLRASEPSSQQAALELDDFRRAFACLTDEQREVLVLVGAAGFDYEQAAAIAGCATGTVKSRVSRARRELRTLLESDALSGPRRPIGDNDGLMADIDRQLGLVAETVPSAIAADARTASAA